MTTMHLTISLSNAQANVHSMSGTPATPMTLPPAYQVATPFGADVGGVHPTYFSVANNEALGFAEFDSWLTIGITDGSSPGAVALSPDFDVATTWTEVTGISETNATVFMVDPAAHGANAGAQPIVLVQMTVTAATAAGGTAAAQVSGKSAGGGADWVHAAAWSWGGTAAAAPGPPP